VDQSYLLALGLAILVALGAGARVRNRMLAHRMGAADGIGESPFAVSTEGHKICPKCGMGNLWTDRTCISCGGPLKG
jgi:hypothetical protein